MARILVRFDRPVDPDAYFFISLLKAAPSVIICTKGPRLAALRYPSASPHRYPGLAFGGLPVDESHNGAREHVPGLAVRVRGRERLHRSFVAIAEDEPDIRDRDVVRVLRE